MRGQLVSVVLAVGVLIGARPAMALDEEHRVIARGLVEDAIAYLRSQQDESGGWSVPPEGSNRPHLPGITALVVNGMIVERDIGADDPAMSKAVAYLMGHRKEDGGFYDRILAAYNTALTVSAFSRVNTPETAATLPEAVDFLKGLQWHEGALGNVPEVGRVSRDHPFYGGVGYGGSSRPDNSNLNLWLQAMHDAGVPSEDPAYRRASVFLSRTQMLDSVNDMAYADGSSQGGFIYATSPSGEEVGVGESKAGRMVETLTTGEEVSRLRAYGSMTYAGFKSLIYADLEPGDERVDAALGWIRRNYTLEENPGIGTDGLYYYYLAFGRALDAFGVSALEVADAERVGEVTIARRGERVRFEYDLTSGDGDPERGTLSGPGRFERVESSVEGDDVFRLELGGRSRMLRPLGDARVRRDALGRLAGLTGRVEVRSLRRVDWQNDLVARLEEMQEEDGSFRVVDDRWMEDNPVLITAYALIALQAVLD